MRICEECKEEHDQHSPICMKCYIKLYREPLDYEANTSVRTSEGEVIAEFNTYSEAWHFIVRSNNKDLWIYEGDLRLYHQPNMVME